MPPEPPAGIATGAPVPDGADAIVPIEVTEERDGGLVAAAPAVGACIRRMGEDVAAGDADGHRRHGALAGGAGGAGVGRCMPSSQVARRPRVAAIATGSELVAAGMPLGARPDL